MKKIFHIATGLLLAVLFAGCDVNEQFDGLDEMAKPTNLTKYTYTLVDADYKTISDRALKLAGDAIDSAAAKSINTNKYFTDAAPASVYVGLLLNTKYPYADINSSANITYAYGQTKPAYISELGTVNILQTADYQTAWGSTTSYVSAFTPAVSAAAKLPAYLSVKFPTATEGQYKLVEYNYSSTEAATQSAEVVYFSENWENHTFATSSPYTVISENGWIQKDTVAASVKGKYYGRVYSGNKYAQVTSNGTGEKNDVFLVSSEIDLSLAIAPKFTFDINVGYWNGNLLKVYVSENFNGTLDGISTATWVDISSSFTFPEVPTGAYGTIAPAGEANLTAYAGKKIYIAYKYAGDSRTATTPKLTTTYQIDNIKISEVKVTLAVTSTVKQYAIYKKGATAWTPADDSFVALQAADYTAMGKTYLATADVPLYVPTFLTQKYPYAQAGAVKTVVYKSSSSNQTYSAATQYTLTSGVWVANTFKMNKTEQFVYSNDGWLFDPTVSIEMGTIDYQRMVDYIKTHPDDNIKQFYDQKNNNAEYYYGFASGFKNVSFRLSYRNPYFTAEFVKPASIDAELYALTTTADKVALLWTRLEKGMAIFLQLTYPNAIPQVSGLDVYYNVKVNIYTPDGVTTSITDVYTYKYKCTAAGSGSTKPTFEFVSKTKM